MTAVVLADLAKRFLGVDMLKKAGIAVKRPVFNAQDIYDWAVKHGVPNPVPADKLHVTIIASPVRVQLKPVERPEVIASTSGCFCMMGPEADVLAFAFESYWCADRHYDYLRAGATCHWPTYRPHLTLSYSPGDFELTDEALRDFPDYIVLDGEITEPFDPNWSPADEADSEGDGDNIELVIVVDLARSAAQKALLEHHDEFHAIERMALYDITKAEKVSAGVVERLLTNEHAPVELKKMLEKPAPSSEGEVKKTHLVEKEVTFNGSLLGSEVAKKLGIVDAMKADDDEQMVTMIASVSTVGGKPYVDLHKDTIRTQALIEFSRSLVTGTRAGQFDHNGDNRNEVVQSFVLSEDIQKSLGIDLGFECLLIEMHVPDPKDWAEVKKGGYCASIRGTMFIEETADAV